MIAFIIINSIWFVSELLLNRFFRSRNSSKSYQDKGSIRIILITIGISINLGIITSIFLKFPISKLIIIHYIGLFLIMVGMIFRSIAIWSLGKFFAINVTIQENHKIIKNGLYKIIRHPAYLGGLISFFGLGISVNNWVSLIMITIPILVAILNRIKIEKKLLLKEFELGYSEYMKKTYRLLPFIF